MIRFLSMKMQYFSRIKKHKRDILIKLAVTVILPFIVIFLMTFPSDLGIINRILVSFKYTIFLNLIYWPLSLIFNNKYGIIDKSNDIGHLLYLGIFILTFVFTSIQILKGKYGATDLIDILLQHVLAIVGMGALSFIIYKVIRGWDE